ncbi:TlpA family protein disulfide reductase [Robertkochia aurantiaca]|uniref:TlpA family protein disulfide reductase n=1 Tax=Robertkochia aurantiaca TaxID=2873700 RepID=UPI001CCEDFD4|nr:TlpA disulfide reductase family protein [Robertkochia sp. 3YJGBD-33]
MDLQSGLIKMNMAEEGMRFTDGKITTFSNDVISTEQFRGSYLVIDFWATWCAPCVKEAPVYKEIAEAFSEKNIVFISVSLDHDFEVWKSFLKDREWNPTHHYWYGKSGDDPFLSIAYSAIKMTGKTFYGITLPKYVIISPTGEILSNSGIRPGTPDFINELRNYF